MSSYRVVVWECTHLSKYVAAFKLEIGPCYYLCPDSFQQLWTVALWATQSMAKSVTPLGTHMDSQSPTTVMKAISCCSCMSARAICQILALSPRATGSRASANIMMYSLCTHAITCLFLYDHHYQYIMLALWSVPYIMYWHGSTKSCSNT